jgi:transposase InsO family protein
MPWMKTTTLDEKRRFVSDWESGDWSVTELCERYGVSRPTGYELIRRYRARGEAGLADLSRATRSCPHRTPASVERFLLDARRLYGWGAKKLLWRLETERPDVSSPSRSTVNDILDRHGLLKKRRRRKRWLHPGAAPLATDRPNQVWTGDFKGQFPMGNRVYCFPLTIVDHFSRYILRCEALTSVRTDGAKPVMERLFREVGLPEAIRTDNGAPFASTGIHGLCSMNVWWMQLGIVHQRIRPSSPQENGAHERMHLDLKREATRPPEPNLRSQRRRLENFRERYNYVRPHEALGGRTPASIWAPSPRPYPDRLPKPEYPAPLEVRRVSHAGTFRIRSIQIFLSNALAEQNIGLEEIDDGLWNIVYFKTLLGRFDERDGIITGA